MRQRKNPAPRRLNAEQQLKPHNKEPIPAVRFFGEHRYFGSTGELITQGVVEVRTTIGRDAARDDYFVCGGRLQSIAQPNCPNALCACSACLVDQTKDDLRAIARAMQQCGCIKCRRRKRSAARSLARGSDGSRQR